MLLLLSSVQGSTPKDSLTPITVQLQRSELGILVKIEFQLKAVCYASIVAEMYALGASPTPSAGRKVSYLMCITCSLLTTLHVCTERHHHRISFWACMCCLFMRINM